MDTRTPPRSGRTVGRADVEPPPLDMTLEGEFSEPPSPPLSVQVTRVAVVVAVLAGLGALALLALWAALVLIPVAVGAGLVAWAALRFRQWREGR